MLARDILHFFNSINVTLMSSKGRDRNPRKNGNNLLFGRFFPFENASPAAIFLLSDKKQQHPQKTGQVLMHCPATARALYLLNTCSPKKSPTLVYSVKKCLEKEERKEAVSIGYKKPRIPQHLLTFFSPTISKAQQCKWESSFFLRKEKKESS